jgi:hypothetical protein
MGNPLAKRAYDSMEKSWPHIAPLLNKKKNQLTGEEKKLLNSFLGNRECIFFKGKSDHYFKFIPPKKFKDKSISEQIKSLLGYRY